jgi:hypothetical protein
MPRDSVDELIKTTDPTKLRVKSRPNRIWVFGGPMEHCVSNGKYVGSLRAQFWSHTLQSVSDSHVWFGDLDRPENYPEWWAFSGYDDLLRFEIEACYLSKAVLLFAESPGSIAELGAFSTTGSIVSKLIVVFQSLYEKDPERRSFINLGPLRRVREHGYECVIGTKCLSALPPADIKVIEDSVSDALGKIHNQLVFNPKRAADRLLLIAEIVDLLGVVKTDEIDQVLHHFSAQTEKHTLERYLALLSFFSIIERERRGKDVFWVTPKLNQSSWIDFNGVAGANFDPLRFKAKNYEWISDDLVRVAIFKGRT